MFLQTLNMLHLRQGKLATQKLKWCGNHYVYNDDTLETSQWLPHTLLSPFIYLHHLHI